jgi:hypothetical protein
MSTQSRRQELEEKILSKRQQIEFEKTNVDTITEFASENRENPDVMEESKNYNDPASSVVETDELKSLRAAEQDLQDLLAELERLGNS